ncbi:hypothetical protein IAD21_00783 [Abditibacteriota bacterium]|nr:hypothetical protein IAD21_00783 [Abditibacteriota bacterium]
MTETSVSLFGSLDFAGLSPFHLSEEQIRFFDDNGYLILRDWIKGDLLARLQEAGHHWIERGVQWGQEHLDALGGDQREGDYVFAKRPNGRVLFRCNYLHAQEEAVSLELLGSPQVLGVIESLCGHNFVPTYEAMVFKMPGDGEVIPWHQDAVFPHKYRAFNFDLYLDASRQGGGALHVIPGTQHQGQDICQIAEQHGWNPPGMITVEMEAGDVLIHDDMVVHGSPRAEGAQLRRTIYFEFRSIEHILEEGPWDRDWIDKRMRLVPLALKRFGNAYPDSPQFAWQAEEQFRPTLSDDETTELRVVHEIHTPGSFCSAGSAFVPTDNKS